MPWSFRTVEGAPLTWAAVLGNGNCANRRVVHHAASRWGGRFESGPGCQNDPEKRGGLNAQVSRRQDPFERQGPRVGPRER